MAAIEADPTEQAAQTAEIDALATGRGQDHCQNIRPANDVMPKRNSKFARVPTMYGVRSPKSIDEANEKTAQM
jgi:hypothetical protein